jgi:hypothetical protein
VVKEEVDCGVGPTEKGDMVSKELVIWKLNPF